jgi:phosphohistidine phosphatase
MKRLYVIRHAKSRKDIPDIDDADRPLDRQGERECAAMAKRLKKLGIYVDAAYSSPAKRALDTAKPICQSMGLTEGDIHLLEVMYESSVAKLMGVIRAIEEPAASAAIFGHNPEFLEIVNHLTPAPIREFPTCAVFGVDFDVSTWAEVEKKSGVIALFEAP